MIHGAWLIILYRSRKLVVAYRIYIGYNLRHNKKIGHAFGYYTEYDYIRNIDLYGGEINEWRKELTYWNTEL